MSGLTIGVYVMCVVDADARRELDETISVVEQKYDLSSQQAFEKIVWTGCSTIIEQEFGPVENGPAYEQSARGESDAR